jgi:predicted regulator of Ras-like GTPase activity (Roadblock/LC7/MglB family)
MADETAAERALAHLYEVSADMRGGAILSADGSVLAASGEAEIWGPAAKRLLEAADRAGAEPAQQLHVATEEGEVFAVRVGGLTAVAVTERFALASLMTFDIRAVLRDLSSTPEKAGAG